MKKYNWHSYFPFQKPRPEQVQAIEFALSVFSTEKRFLVMELPTGVGKSAVAITLAQYFANEPFIEGNENSAYIITTQKILQQQYKDDFPYIANISAKQNYLCNKRPGLSCEMGLTIAKILLKNSGRFAGYTEDCTYHIARANFIDSQISVTNLHFFLAHAKEIFYNVPNPTITKRKLIVIDECHNLESIVVDNAALEFKKYLAEEYLKIDWPKVNKMDILDFMDWVKNTYSRKLQSEMQNLASKLDSMQSESFLTSNSGISMMRKIEDMKRMHESIESASEHFNEKDWVMTVAPTEDVVTIKPIYAKEYTQPFIFSFGKKILLMSGTILDKETYCNNVGIPIDQAEFISMDSPFPVKNRPIFVVPSGSLSRKNIKQSLPNVINVMEQLLEHHKTEKGIVHCNSYEIAKYINDHIPNKRLLFHSSDDRMEVLNYHKTTKEPTVLVSPSFTEGIDLIDDLARFAIIVKIPFPYLGDNYIVTKMERISGWYNWETVKTIVQASGRTVRHIDDTCATYVLDGDFSWFYERNKNMFPRWYKDAIIF